MSVHVSAICKVHGKVSKLSQPVTLEPFQLERYVNSQTGGYLMEPNLLICKVSNLVKLYLLNRLT